MCRCWLETVDKKPGLPIRLQRLVSLALWGEATHFWEPVFIQLCQTDY
jgi:hypothetical protein